MSQELELRGCSLLKELDEESLATLAESLERVPMIEGARLFECGDSANGLLLVASGSLRLLHPQRGDCGRVEAGGSLGGASLMSSGNRELSAVVEGSGELWRLSELEFRTLIDCEPRLACQLLEAITRELASCARAACDVLETGLASPASDVDPRQGCD